MNLASILTRKEYSKAERLLAKKEIGAEKIKRREIHTLQGVDAYEKYKKETRAKIKELNKIAFGF